MVSSLVYIVNEGDEKTYAKSAAQHSTNGEYKGMVEKRHTTDVLFFLLIFAMWIAMSVIGGIAVRDGNPYRLIAPIDSKGSMCGISASVKNDAKFYTVNAVGVGMCTDTCPTRTALTNSTDPDDYLCLNWVTEALSNPSYAAFTDKITYIQDACFVDGEFDPFTGDGLSGCSCMLIQPTRAVFNRCIFTSSETRGKFSNQSVPDYFVDFMSDIITARYVIFAFGFLLALLCSFFYSHLLRYETIGQCVCWTGLTMVFLMMIVLVGLCQNTYMEWKKEDPQVHGTTARYALVAFSIILIILVGLFLCGAIFLRRSINLAIKALSLAATAIERMPLIMLSPFIQVFGLIVFLCPCLFYGFNVASAGTLTYTYTTYSGTSYPSGVTYKLDDIDAQEKLWFLTFCFLWTANFIAGIGSLMIAVSVSKWYFNSDRSTITSNNMWNSYGIIFRFHMGTAAFGGLIIAFVQMARAVALYIEKHFKKVMGGNPVLRCVFCCVDCCLCLLEKCLKFISKQAYIQTAIHGSSFCTACKDAFFTIARNIFTIGAVSVVSGLALFIGKIWVMTVAGIGGYYYMQGQYNDKMKDFIAPTVLIMAIAYMTATMFMEVFHMAVDTVIMCYITDEEQNGGKAVFADPQLADFIHENGKLSDDHKRVEGKGGDKIPTAAPDKIPDAATRPNEI